MPPAINEVKSAPSGLNSKLVMPFVNSTLDVFRTMVKVSPEIIKPSLKTDAAATYDVSGIIGFSGDIIGSVVVSFEMAAAQKLVSALAGMEIESSSADFSDAIGEPTNMIVGSAKRNLGKVTNIGIPVVVVGTNHKICRLTSVPCVLIPCKTPVGNFAVEVNIKPIA